MRSSFLHFKDICRQKLKLSKNGLEIISGLNHSVVSSESETLLHLIGFGNRNISVFEFDKISHDLSIQKALSFFSDKIKILFEDDGQVFLLNSEKKLCVTNSKNQSLINVISESSLEQALFFSDSKFSSQFIIAECNSELIILKLSNNKLEKIWTLDCGTVSSQICLRGSYFSVRCSSHAIIIKITGFEDIPFEIFKFNLKYISLDVLQHNLDDRSLTLLGYSYLESEGKISTFKTNECSVLDVIEFKEPALINSKLEFGRYLCFAGNQIC